MLMVQRIVLYKMISTVLFVLYITTNKNFRSEIGVLGLSDVIRAMIESIENITIGKGCFILFFGLTYVSSE